MIEYVIKIENDTPVGYPMLAENFIQTYEFKNTLNIPNLKKAGFAPFYHREKPQETLTKKVKDNGLTVCDDGYVKQSFELVPKKKNEIDFDALREQKRQELKVERDTRIAMHINNVQVDTLDSRENIKGVIDNWETLNLKDTVNWVMADNTVQPLSKDDLIAIKTSYVQRKDECFKMYQQAVDLLDDSNTVNDILSVQWPQTTE